MAAVPGHQQNLLHEVNVSLLADRMTTHLTIECKSADADNRREAVGQVPHLVDPSESVSNRLDAAI